MKINLSQCVSLSISNVGNADALQKKLVPTARELYMSLTQKSRKKKAEGINQIGYGRAEPLSVAQCQSTADHLKCEQDTAVPVSFR